MHRTQLRKRKNEKSAARLGGLEVDHQLILSRRLQGKIGRRARTVIQAQRRRSNARAKKGGAAVVTRLLVQVTLLPCHLKYSPRPRRAIY